MHATAGARCCVRLECDDSLRGLHSTDALRVCQHCDDHRHELPPPRPLRPQGQRAFVRLVGDLRQPARQRPRARVHGGRLRCRRQFLRQRRGLREGRVGNDHGRRAEEDGLAPLVVHRLDQVLLGPARRTQRKAHAEPQVPDAGDRRLARAPCARLCRPRVLPSARSRHAARGNRAGDVRHDHRGQGQLLGHVGMERGRDRRGVAHRGPPPLAQAGDRAAAVQPPPPRARREREYARLYRRPRYRHHHLEPAGLGTPDRQVQRRHPAGFARHVEGLRVAGRAPDRTGQDRQGQTADADRAGTGMHARADVAGLVPQESARVDGDHGREPTGAGAREHAGARRRAASSTPDIMARIDSVVSA